MDAVIRTLAIVSGYGVFTFTMWLSLVELLCRGISEKGTTTHGQGYFCKLHFPSVVTLMVSQFADLVGGPHVCENQITMFFASYAKVLGSLTDANGTIDQTCQVASARDGEIHPIRQLK